MTDLSYAEWAFMLSVDKQALSCHYFECHYAECHYAECHFVVCYYAERRYVDCRGAIPFITAFTIKLFGAGAKFVVQ